MGAKLLSPRPKRRNLYLNIQAPEDETSTAFDSINDVLVKHAKIVDMRRLDHRNHTLQLTYYLDCKDQRLLSDLTQDLKHTIPGCSFTFVDQENMPR